jgi:biotin carboxyl carrier protein
LQVREPLVTQEVDDFHAPEPTPMRERVVIAPATGKFIPHPPETFTTEGEWVEPGVELAEIHTGSSVLPVSCNFRGWMMGMLVVPGQPVHQGAPLFWIRSA